MLTIKNKNCRNASFYDFLTIQKKYLHRRIYATAINNNFVRSETAKTRTFDATG